MWNFQKYIFFVDIVPSMKNWKTNSNNIRMAAALSTKKLHYCPTGLEEPYKAIICLRDWVTWSRSLKGHN